MLKTGRDATNRIAGGVDRGRLKKQVRLSAIICVWKMEKAATLVMLQPPAPAREPIAWRHVPSQPLMRSPLSQFQTPTAPRRNSRFFRVWLPFRLPCRQITRLNSDWQDLFCQSFQPSTSAKLNSCFIAVNAILGTIAKYL